MNFIKIDCQDEGVVRINVDQITFVIDLGAPRGDPSECQIGMSDGTSYRIRSRAEDFIKRARRETAFQIL